MRKRDDYQAVTPSAASTGATSAPAMLQDCLAAWVATRGRLPAPCPADLAECAQWWLAHMSEPMRPGQDVAEYGAHCRAALLGFLRLDSEMERHAVVAGVRDDLVAYRGDKFSFYQRVADETHMMRQDKTAYIEAALSWSRSAATAMGSSL